MTDDAVRYAILEERAGFDAWEIILDVVNSGNMEAKDALNRVIGNRNFVYSKCYDDRVQVAIIGPRSEK